LFENPFADAFRIDRRVAKNKAFAVSGLLAT
jgi:hypothetical protein